MTLQPSPPRHQLARQPSERIRKLRDMFAGFDENKGFADGEALSALSPGRAGPDQLVAIFKAPHVRKLSAHHGLQPQSFPVKLPDDSPPGGKMAKQTKPFIVEIKQSRKVKTGVQTASIWGSLDLRMADDRLAEVNRTDEPAATVVGDRS